MHRIIFTGAQGTGKTTVLNYFAEQGQNVITEVVRNLAKKGVKINKDGDEKGQGKIFKEYEKLLGEITPEGYISDRGLIDVVAYTVYLCRHGKVSEKFVEKQIKALKKFRAANPDITYCYFPIEFPVIADEVRDIDEDFRAEIDDIIQHLLVDCQIQPIIIRGSVEKRINKIVRLQNWLAEGMYLYTSDWNPETPEEATDEEMTDEEATDVEGPVEE